jgi:hypothetical protein
MDHAWPGLAALTPDDNCAGGSEAVCVRVID